MNEIKNIYFEHKMSNNLMSYNMIWNMIVSNRSFGKTYWLLVKCALNYIKNGEQFIYLRRSVIEIDYKHTKDLYKKASRDIRLKDVWIRVESGAIELTRDIDSDMEDKDRKWEQFGYIMALGQAVTFKSIDFPDVTTIMYEEFLIKEKGGRRYLDNEPRELKDFYITIARERTNVKVYLLANALSMHNPYFPYFNLYPYTQNKEFYTNKKMSALLCFPSFSAKEHQEYMMKLHGGSDEEYNDYAFKNGFLNDSDTFIEKRSKEAKYIYTIVCNSEKYGVWQDYLYGVIYISSKVDNGCKFIYSFTNKDHMPNMMLVKNYNKFPRIKQLKEAYEYGYLRFENAQLKSRMTECLKWLG